MQKTLLNLGSGPHSVLKDNAHRPWAHDWTEIRVDVEPACKPDIVAPLLELGDKIATDSADIVYCSHVLEHMHDHDIVPVLREMRRMLRPSGVAMILTPDLLQVAEVLLRDELDVTVYTAPAGNITILDILFGHRMSIQNGMPYMAHKTGFTESALAAKLLDAGFDEIATKQGMSFDFTAFAYNGTKPYTNVLDDLQSR